jgi:NADP-dependent aldehyde dehydrogenase
LRERWSSIRRSRPWASLEACVQAERCSTPAAGASEPIPVYAEMGSVNPVFILPGALAERAAAIAAGLKDSVTMGVGQFCTKPGLTIRRRRRTLRRVRRQLDGLMSAAASGTMLTPNHLPSRTKPAFDV